MELRAYTIKAQFHMTLTLDFVEAEHLKNVLNEASPTGGPQQEAFLNELYDMLEATLADNRIIKDGVPNVKARAVARFTKPEPPVQGPPLEEPEQP